ncbi:ABC-type dipeptide/oligopeptide/nickel transport system, permease component [Clostridium aceticum]|uniref:Nickel import system permease protein NikB n=1 Tax=Clostridium aceticum TaxID=84022 RepID=A0A0D8ICK6_9CLOT|nr:nickel ABC transporter permease [Clostridium aceticum]AKL96334.1 ABC-type dipeptide/oligopeptide/nickel transport system, permease component [Clostridium aceticum]KJF26926.1 nickel transporter permease NikB [Clostridium aceticum]
MLKLVKARLMQLVVLLFVLSLVTFTLMKLAPGDPVLLILQADEVAVTQAEEAALREELGFDQPVLLQYGQWMFKLLQLDLGESHIKGKPVAKELMDRLPDTLQLTAGGILVMVMISAPLGILAAKYAGRWPDHLSRLLALLGASIPAFWLGLILIYIFAYKLQWFPTMGKGGLQHMVLPSFALGFAMASVYARLLRSGLLESLSQEYIRAARGRGIAEWRVLLIHGLRAALLPIVTVFGMSLGSILGGTVVIETLFSWPGLGSMVVTAIFQRDYPIIQGYILLVGVCVVVVNLLVDLSYGLLDPRIRYGKGESR